MSEDHLSTEVSLSAELTDRGIKAGAKSRAISSIDRLLGGVVDLVNVPLESAARKGRAKADLEVAVIQALGEKQLEAIHADPEFAARAMQQHVKSIGTRHENKTEAVKVALEDLRSSPPTEDQNNAGGETLSDGFLNRWERYAEDATSDQVREKWGRILASEIRAPGTFSSKVMRVIDELEPETALLFERVCKARVGMTLIACMVGKLEYLETKRLVAAGLLVDAGEGGQIRQASRTINSAGKELFLFGLGRIAIGFDVNEKLDVKKTYGSETLKQAITLTSDLPAIPVYILTDVGHAVSSIIAHDEEAVIRNYLQILSTEIAPASFFEYYDITSKGGFQLVRTWVTVEPSSEPE